MRCDIASRIGWGLSKWPADQPWCEGARAGALGSRHQLWCARRISCGARVLGQVHVGELCAGGHRHLGETEKAWEHGQVRIDSMQERGDTSRVWSYVRVRNSLALRLIDQGTCSGSLPSEQPWSEVDFKERHGF